MGISEPTRVRLINANQSQAFSPKTATRVSHPLKTKGDVMGENVANLTRNRKVEGNERKNRKIRKMIDDQRSRQSPG